MPGQVIFEGSINQNAQMAPGVYVQTLQPKNALVTGAPTDITLYVGTASWGAVGVPVTISSPDDCQRSFGPILAQKYDMGTHVAIAAALGANNFRCVRVTDGTDVAASATIMDTAGTPAIGVTLTAFYTGAFGNNIKAYISAGSNSVSGTLTYKVTIVLPNSIPEVFDNIGGTGATLWQNIVTAINQGQGDFRPPSQLVVATIGTGTAAPNLTTYTLANGANGNSSVNGAALVGLDTTPRKGMYAGRNTGANMAVLCDCDDTTTYSAQVNFGLSEGMLMFLTGPSNQSLSAAITAKQTAGVDTTTAKVLIGDWVLFQDNYNNVQRVVSPQSAAAARYATLAPQESGLNKQISILGTQSSLAKRKYSNAEIIQMRQAGLDVIATPAPGNGNYFSLQTGQNASSNPLIYGDEYTRLTYFLAFSLFNSVGVYIGRIHNASTESDAKSSIDSFLQDLKDREMIEDFKTVLDASNNSPTRKKQGFMQADVQVSYFGIVRVFLINLQTGVITVQ